MTVIETERLLLRTWKEADVEPCYEMNQDPRVIEFLPTWARLDSRKKVKLFIADQDQIFVETGYCFWAVEEKSTNKMIGFLGFMKAKEPLPSSAIEIGWRFNSESWGKGYATEGAYAVLDYGFKVLSFLQVLSCTSTDNQASRRVMGKIGMIHDPQGDFIDPHALKNERLSLYALYRIERNQWKGVQQ